MAQQQHISAIIVTIAAVAQVQSVIGVKIIMVMQSLYPVPQAIIMYVQKMGLE